jgi:hypothetical protein
MSAPPEDPAEIEHLDGVTCGEMGRHDAGIAAERAAGAQGAGQHVAGPQGQHPAGGVLDGVVGRLVLEDSDRQHVAFGGHDLVAHDHLGRKRGIPGAAADPVQPDAGGDDHRCSWE